MSCGLRLSLHSWRFSKTAVTHSHWFLTPASFWYGFLIGWTCITDPTSTCATVVLSLSIAEYLTAYLTSLKDNKLRHFFKLIWLLNLSQPKFGKKWRNLEIFNSCYLSWFWLIKKQEFLGVYKYKAQLRKTTRLQLILPCIFSVVQMMTFNLLWYCQVRGFARMNRGGKFHIKEAVALRQWRVLQDNLA